MHNSNHRWQADRLHPPTPLIVLSGEDSGVLRSFQNLKILFGVVLGGPSLQRKTFLGGDALSILAALFVMIRPNQLNASSFCAHGFNQCCSAVHFTFESADINHLS